MYDDSRDILFFYVCMGQLPYCVYSIIIISISSIIQLLILNHTKAVDLPTVICLLLRSTVDLQGCRCLATVW